MKITHATDIDRKKIVLDGCMITYSGIVFDLMKPNPDLINIEDIAHGLAFNCRWNGATKYFYSIAEHSIRVSARCIPNFKSKQLAGLFHDAEEAYWGDMIRPLKEIIKINSPEVIQRMIDLRSLIFDKYNLSHINVDKEDWDELIWDFEELILKKDYMPLTPEYAEGMWKSYVDSKMGFILKS
jgi:5'-deoxynucleotidase YfbR-like HD superfamily hydrolase